MVCLTEGKCLYAQHRSLLINWRQDRDLVPPWWLIKNTTVVLSVLTRMCLPDSSCLKCLKVRNTAHSSRRLMWEALNCGFQLPRTPRCWHSPPHPLAKASVVTTSQRAGGGPIGNPFWRNLSLLQSPRDAAQMVVTRTSVHRLRTGDKCLAINQRWNGRRCKRPSWMMLPWEGLPIVGSWWRVAFNEPGTLLEFPAIPAYCPQWG